MWQWIVKHRADVELVASCWLAVQVAAGMPTPRDTSSTAYKWAFNVAHAVTNLPRLLSTAFPEAGWVTVLFGNKAGGQAPGNGGAKS
jgi:hypothetical protein